MNWCKNKWKSLERSQNSPAEYHPMPEPWSTERLPPNALTIWIPGLDLPTFYLLICLLHCSQFSLSDFRFRLISFSLFVVLLCQCVSPVNSYASSHSGGFGWQKNYLDQSLLGKGTVDKIGTSGQYEFIYWHILLSNWLLW